MTNIAVMTSAVNSANTQELNSQLNSTVVFIDAGVADYEFLAAGVLPGVTVVILNREQNGITQITEFLKNQNYFTNVHIVSHGSPGCLYLGNSRLGLDNLESYASQLEHWFYHSLANREEKGNLLLYGCNVAAGDAGEEFIAKLQQLMGTEIAASKTLTGSAVLGGNWHLEVHSNTKLSPVFYLETLHNYSGIFAYINEVEANDSIATAQFLSPSSFTLDSDSNIQLLNGTNISTTYPHASINGTGNGTADFYSFTASAGQQFVFDIDNNDFDSRLILFDASGTELANNDDDTEVGNIGGTNPSFITYTFLTSGTYYIRVAHYTSNVVANGNNYTLHISYNNPNSPPVAQNDSFSTNEDTAITNGNLLSNNGGGADSDPNAGDTLSISAINGTSFTTSTTRSLTYGSLFVNGNGTFNYTPFVSTNSLAQGASVTETFTYTLRDSGGLTSNATVTVNITGVNDAPVTGNDTFSTNEDTNLNNVNLFSNDYDVDAGSSFTISAVNGTTFTGSTTQTLTYGTLTVNSNGTFSFDPGDSLAQGATQAQTFTYTIRDNNNATSNAATVTINITGVNDAPDAKDDNFTVNEDTGITNGNLFNNNGNGVDTDPDTGDTRIITAVNGFAGNLGTAINLTYGTVSVNSNGTFNYDPIDTLAQGESVTETFTYILRDGFGLTDTATVSLNITGQNDAPTISNTVSGQTVTDKTTINPFSGVSIADVDIIPTPQTLSVTVSLDDPTLGNLTNLGSFIDIGGGSYEFTGTATAATTAIRTLVFTPSENSFAANQIGTGTFTITVNDGIANPVSDSNTTIDISSVNDNPIATDDIFSTNETSPVTGNLVYLDNGNGLDSDVDINSVLGILKINGNSISYGLPITLPSGALLTILADASFTYNAGTGFASLAQGELGTEQFTYTLGDEANGTDTATVTINITGINDAPTVVNPIAIQRTSTVDPFSLNISSRFNDINIPKGDSLGFSSSNLPSGLSLNSSTGLISGQVNTGGIYNVTLTATDSYGANVSTNMGLVVRGVINATGSNDNISGTSAPDRISGFAGNDVLQGFGGDDEIFGGEGNDFIYGGDGIDYLTGDNGSDRIYGGNGDDFLYGGNSRDYLVGDAGRDYFDGGADSDYYYGSTDGLRDVFVIARGESGTSLTGDAIYYFEMGIDKIGLKGGLNFTDLSFVSSTGKTTIMDGTATIATIYGSGINWSSTDFITV
ncbi:DUF4347 domain-containing protein [Nostoc parmelioides]|uniref:DUF4347 domain-containing protein n=1 Tax=Nostoc parmelioides FACHB-3921 TaxID=2692909 RepID=A0ABR8BMM5_9NOSO|nr:DUF4347 domain-containing protein [Nostoc parmelioides]MBD2254549.1 DUF4347 domain-containing protein [Nostoc parmelioides FACHB-3921]